VSKYRCPFQLNGQGLELYLTGGLKDEKLIMQRLEVGRHTENSAPGGGNNQTNALMQGKVPCVLVTGRMLPEWLELSESNRRV
jgi:hypothetical protein